MSRLTARLERLEAVLKPSGRAFVLVWRADKDGPLAEKEAEYRAEHGVGPYDTLVTVIIRSERRGTERGTASHSTINPNWRYSGRRRTTRSGSLRGAKRRMRRLRADGVARRLN